MKISDLLHPMIFLRRRYYWERVRKAKSFNQLIDNDKVKALQMKWLSFFGKKLNLRNPVTLNEKIQWLECFTKTDKWTVLADKYEVRKFVIGKGLGHILTKCYGVWSNADEIDFNILPESFVLKGTHDCKSSYIVRNKKCDLDEVQARTLMRESLGKKFGYDTCEPHYTKIVPRIMAEEYLEDNSNDSSSIIDYKIWCFNGQPECIFVVYNRPSNVNVDQAVYDLYTPTWEQIDEKLTPHYRKSITHKLNKPRNLKTMLEVATTLSQGFPQVRIDLYNIKGKVYFGEMTFTSEQGRMGYFTNAYQIELGKKVILPNKDIIKP